MHVPLETSNIICLFVQYVIDTGSKIVASTDNQRFKLASAGISVPFNEVCIVADVKPLER